MPASPLQSAAAVKSPADWKPHLALGITGHRSGNPVFARNRAAIEAGLAALFGEIDRCAAVPEGTHERPRLYSLLVDGTDQIAAELALARGWDLIVPLPFGANLNLAINAHPQTCEDAAALARGEAASDPAVEARAAAIRAVTARAHLFELADRDAEVEALLLASLGAPEDRAAARAFETLASENVALAGRVIIERTDLVIAVWDGKAARLPGGTGHTVTAALAMGTPVLVLDPAAPGQWSILTRPEELGHLEARTAAPDHERLAAIIHAAIRVEGWTPALLEREAWRAQSSRAFGFYRRIERVFGGGPGAWGSTRVAYEAPGAIAHSGGSGAAIVAAARAMPGADPAMAARLAGEILPMFAWADGIASRLGDAYRSGMCTNFVLAALAVIVGMAFLPAGLSQIKWAFAGAELLLLSGILVLTAAGSRLGWHRRWFELRRVAEYLRHAPVLLLLGVARPTGRWPRSGTGTLAHGAGHSASGTIWPEHFARHALRSAGLPRARLTRDYLRAGLADVALPHVIAQRAYHEAKAQRLERVHHRLDRAAETCFVLAVVAVLGYLLLKGASLAGWVPGAFVKDASPLFTFLGVAFPTLGANLAGIRYFGDFERFGAISRVASEKLREIETRITLLIAGADSALTYAAAAELLHALDEAVVEEIASWQSVFGAKHLALPA